MVQAPVWHSCGDRAALANVAVAPGSDCLCCLFDGSSAWLGWMPTLLVPSRVPVCQLVLCCSLTVPACLWPFISAHRQPVWSLLHKRPQTRLSDRFGNVPLVHQKANASIKQKVALAYMKHHVKYDPKWRILCMKDAWICQVVNSQNAYCRFATDALNWLSKHLMLCRSILTTIDMLTNKITLLVNLIYLFKVLCSGYLA